MTKRMLPAIALAAALSLSGCLSIPPAYRASGTGCVPKTATPAPARGAIYFVAVGDPDCAGDSLAALSVRRGSFHVLGERPGEPVRYGFATPGAGNRPKAPVLALAGKDAWYDGLQPAQASPQRILLYVHGYNNSAVAALSAADQVAMAARFDGPVVAFIWPSQHAVGKYTWDEENARWAQAYFNQFLIDLAGRVPEVVLVSHSMGNRLAIDGLRHLQTSRQDLADRIKTVVLASPDIDREVFDRDLLRDIARKGRRIALFASSHDLALRSSWAVHGNPRIGDLGCVFRLRRLETTPSARCYPDAFVAPDAVPLPGDFTVIDGTAITAGLGHGNHIETPEGRTALRQFLAEPPQLPPAKDGRILLAPVAPPDCTSGRSRLRLEFTVARCGKKTRSGSKGR